MSSPLDGIPPDVREELFFFLDPFHIGAIHADRLTAEESVDFVRSKFDIARQKLESEGVDMWLEWRSGLVKKAARTFQHHRRNRLVTVASDSMYRPSFPAQPAAGRPPKQVGTVLPQRPASKGPSHTSEPDEKLRPALPPGSVTPFPGWDPSVDVDMEWRDAVWNAKAQAPEDPEPDRYSPFTIARVVRWLGVHQVRSPLLPDWSAPLGESLAILKNRRILRNRMKILDLAVRLTSDPETRTQYRVDPRKNGPSISKRLAEAIASKLEAESQLDVTVKALSASRVRAILKENSFQTPPGLVFSTSFSLGHDGDEEE